MQCSPENYQGCLEILSHKDSFSMPPWLGGVLSWLVLTVLFVIVVYFIERPILQRQVKSKSVREAEWIETVGMYFGVVMNLSLMIYILIIQYYAERHYHQTQFNQTNPYILSPGLFTLLFVINSMIMFGFIVWGQHKKGHPVKKTGLGIGLGFIGLSALFIFLSLRVMFKHITLDPQQAQYLREAWEEFKQSEFQVKQQYQNQLQEAQKVISQYENTQHLPLSQRIAFVSQLSISFSRHKRHLCS